MLKPELSQVKWDHRLVTPRTFSFTSFAKDLKGIRLGLPETVPYITC